MQLRSIYSGPYSVDKKVFDVFCRSIERGDVSQKLFIEAENSIRDLLRFDSYPRFLKSRLYKQIQSVHFPKMSCYEKQAAVFQIIERRQSHATGIPQYTEMVIRKKTKRRQSALQIIRSAVKEAKSQKVVRSRSMKDETSICVQLSTGDEFMIEG